MKRGQAATLSRHNAATSPVDDDIPISIAILIGDFAKKLRDKTKTRSVVQPAANHRRDHSAKMTRLGSGGFADLSSSYREIRRLLEAPATRPIARTTPTPGSGIAVKDRLSIPNAPLLAGSTKTSISSNTIPSNP